MQIGTHVEALQADLARLAAIGDAAVAEAAERLSQALVSSVGLRLLEALSEAAVEVSGQLEDAHVEVRLVGQDPELVVVRDDAAAVAGPADEAATARITLRLPDSLKTAVEAAAAREGVSVNTWIVRALARGASTQRGRRGPGKRLTGFAEG